MSTPESPETLDRLVSATDLLSDWLGKEVTVFLVQYDHQRQELLRGTVARVYTNAILLQQQDHQRLIYFHAIATIEKHPPLDATVLAAVAHAPSSSQNGCEVSAKYIGE